MNFTNNVNNNKVTKFEITVHSVVSNDFNYINQIQHLNTGYNIICMPWMFWHSAIFRGNATLQESYWAYIYFTNYKLFISVTKTLRVFVKVE